MSLLSIEHSTSQQCFTRKEIKVNLTCFMNYLCTLNMISLTPLHHYLLFIVNFIIHEMKNCALEIPSMSQLIWNCCCEKDFAPSASHLIPWESTQTPHPSCCTITFCSSALMLTKYKLKYLQFGLYLHMNQQILLCDFQISQ